MSVRLILHIPCFVHRYIIRTNRLTVYCRESLTATLWRKFKERRLGLSYGRIPSYNVPPQRPSTPETPTIVISRPAMTVSPPNNTRADQTAFCPPPRGKREFLAWMHNRSKKRLKAILRVRNQSQQEINKERDTEEFKDKSNEFWMSERTVNFPEDKILQPAPRSPHRPGREARVTPHLGGEGSTRPRRVRFQPVQPSASDYERSGGLFSSSPNTEPLGNQALLRPNLPWSGHHVSRRDSD